MDALQSCARKYAELCGYTYDCTIARKNARVSLTFSFSAYEFRHLAGLHRLKHPRLQTNSERLFKDILAGKITLVDLRKASNWEEESEKFLSRLNALAQLDVLMDEFLLIYGFSGEKLARQIMSKGPRALMLAKIAVNYGAETDINTGLMIERLAQTIAFSTEDRKEGTAAFLEKRSAHFTGR